MIDTAYIMNKIRELQEDIEMGFLHSAHHKLRLIEGEILLHKDRARIEYKR